MQARKRKWPEREGLCETGYQVIGKLYSHHSLDVLALREGL